MIRYAMFFDEKHCNFNIMNNFDTMSSQKNMVWYFVAIMVWDMTIPSNIPLKKGCLCVLASAGKCQLKTKKSPHLRGLMCDLMPSGASRCWTWNHSHSIVAGGLPEMS